MILSIIYKHDHFIIGGMRSYTLFRNILKGLLMPFRLGVRPRFEGHPSKRRPVAALSELLQDRLCR